MQVRKWGAWALGLALLGGLVASQAVRAQNPAGRLPLAASSP